MSETIDKCEKKIFFNELKECQIPLLIQNLKPSELVNICKESGAPPEDIYQCWIEKIFKLCNAYVLEFEINDWHQISDYFQTLLCSLTNEEMHDSNKSFEEIFHQWYTNILELIKLLDDDFTRLNIFGVGLLIDFLLNAVERLLKLKTSESQAKSILIAQDELLRLVSKCLEIQGSRADEHVRSLIQVLSRLCDVGVQLSQIGIKSAIETWRIVGKLSTSCYTWSQTINLKKPEQERCIYNVWSQKPLICLFNELHKLLHYIKKNHKANNTNENFFKLMQFYLKLIKIVMSTCNLEDFLASKEFFNCYLLYTSSLKDSALKEHFDKIDVNGAFEEFLQMIYYKNGIITFITTICYSPEIDFNIIMDYVGICLKQHKRNEEFLTDHTHIFIKLFNKLFENSHIYVTNNEYNTCLMNFVTLLLFDSSFAIHKHLCLQVLQAEWIAAHASADILRVYYSFYYKHSNLEMVWSFLEFWFKCLEQYAWCEFDKRKFLIQYILECLVEHIPSDQMQRLLSELPNCGRNTKQLCDISQKKAISETFSRTLNDNLHKLQKLSISQENYFQLLNDLEIAYHKFDSISNIDDILMQLIKTFVELLPKFDGDTSALQLFFNNCFLLLKKYKIRKLDTLLFDCLSENPNQAEAIYSVFMLDCLLQRLPQSRNVLQKLQMPAEFHKVKFLLKPPSNNIKMSNQQIDLKIFRKLDSLSNSQSSYNVLEAKRQKFN